MKRYILILVALIAGMAVHAEDLQKKALADYDNKNYAAAIDDYQQLEKQSGVSAEYYFNLGNAYYRSGKKGKAILCYERALRLNPRYEKAQANLDFVNMKIIDRPEPEENILAVGFRNVQNAMSPTAWTVVAMAAFLLFIAGMATYAFASAITLRKVGFFGGLGLLVVCVFANVFAARANNAATSHDYAVVMNDSTQLSAVSREPLNKDEVAFTLHEGAKLKKNGMRVLGIGDSPYENLLQELRDSLDEYYKVSSLENYDEVFKAVAFFTFKYGKIDWLESNNEYWLMRDAQLRTEFNITTGPKIQDMRKIKFKSAMKEYYAKAGLPTARWHIVEGLEDALDFAHTVGYPVVVKPDNGVGANNTYKLSSDEDLEFFMDHKGDEVYIMEEYVRGYVQTFDAIVDSKGQPLFESGNITPESIMDIVNDNRDSTYYLVKDVPENIRSAGLRTVKAFGVKSRFIHLEFFVLSEDQAGLGKKGDVLGLEVNMRPAGGYTPDMYNYSQETDVYKIWADMVCFDKNTKPIGAHHYCAFYGRRDGTHYKLDDYEIMMKYRDHMVMNGRIPDALSGAMANQMYVATFDTQEELDQFYSDMEEKF